MKKIWPEIINSGLATGKFLVMGNHSHNDRSVIYISKIRNKDLYYIYLTVCFVGFHGYTKSTPLKTEKRCLKCRLASGFENSKHTNITVIWMEMLGMPICVF